MEVDGVGVTQGRTAQEARAMAGDLVAAMLDRPLDQVHVDVAFEVGGIGPAEVSAVKRDLEAAAAAQERAATGSRTLAAKLRAAGLSGRDVAEIMGVSPQRVSQLTNRRATTTRRIQPADPDPQS
ncbi:hypothetical protein Acsp05_23910 [Actinokineospora sp. NBRC 105648]|nr:hypothetical protein Acsp05_23910 [Actinokineospora sp. NBRC 105648]